MENSLKFFENQMKINNIGIATIDDIINLKSKKYSSGRLMNIGDIVLYGMLKTLNDNNNIIYSLCTVHPDELDTLYHAIGYLDEDTGNIFPILTLVKEIIILKSELKSKKENVFKSLNNNLLLVNSINEFKIKLKNNGIEIFEQNENILITEDGYYLAVFKESIKSVL